MNPEEIFKKGSDLLVGTSAFLMHRSIQVPSRSAIRWVLVTAWVWRPSHPDLLLRGKSGVRESHLHNRVGLHCIRPEYPHVRDAPSSIPKKKVKQPNFVVSSIGYKTPMYTKHKGPDPRE